jgi:hypothetical protein
MELPDDVLGLVRAFSRPRMRFYKEYKLSLLELGFEQDEHWHELRDKLCTSDAEPVFYAFMIYKHSFLSLKLLRNSSHQIHPDFYVRYHRELARQENAHEKKDRTLRILLVGEEKVLEYDLWLRYEAPYSLLD